MTEAERRHYELLVAEAEAWKPGMPLPEHPIEEHLLYARKALDEVKEDVRRLRRHFALWVLTWTVIIGTVVYLLLR